MVDDFDLGIKVAVEAQNVHQVALRAHQWNQTSCSIHLKPPVPLGTWAQIHHSQEMRFPFKFTLNSASYGTALLVLSGVK